MNEELDCYGMTKTEREAFETEYIRLTVPTTYPALYYSGSDHYAALVWAACAKIYRERIADLGRQCDGYKARIDELTRAHQGRRERVDEHVERLQKEKNSLRLNLQGRSSAEHALLQSVERADARISALEFQVADLRAQQATDKKSL